MNEKKRMFRYLRADEIDVRVDYIDQRGCSLLLYKDARVDQNILDETFGPFGWMREHSVIGNNLYCTISIYDDVKQIWVRKMDVGVESNYQKEKGAASDSFKRAAFSWGIGRELYTAPSIFIPAGKMNMYQGKDGKLKTNDKFSVGSLVIEDGTIMAITINNLSTGKNVFFMDKRKNVNINDGKLASEEPERTENRQQQSAWNRQQADGYQHKAAGNLKQAEGYRMQEQAAGSRYNNAGRHAGPVPVNGNGGFANNRSTTGYSNSRNENSVSGRSGRNTYYDVDYHSLFG